MFITIFLFILEYVGNVSVWSPYCSFLKALYHRKLDAYEQWSPVRSNEYIPLMFSEITSDYYDTEDDVKKKANRMLAGDINGAFSSRPHVPMNELLGESILRENVKTILIEGAPGIGKTAFTYTLCQKWASGSALHQFKGIIRWSLSDLIESDVTSVSDLIMHDSYDIKMKTAKALCEESGEAILFIFDGWDEIPQDVSKDKVTFLLDLIKGKKLPKASYIVTTRPLQMTKSFKLKRTLFNRCFEISGFSDDNIIDYINKAFLQNPTEAKTLLKQLETRPDIQSMCYIPIHCAIVTYVFGQKKKLPRTLTEFYQIFILNSLLRNLQLRLEGGDNIDELGSLCDLPKEILELFTRLSELAFRGLWAEKHTYSKDEVQSVLHSSAALIEIDRLGILQAQQIFHSTGIKMSFHFLHSSVQQYLGAYFLTSLKAEEQNKYIRTYISLVPFYSLWQFYCGLSSFVNLRQSGFLDKVNEHFESLSSFSDVLSISDSLLSDVDQIESSDSDIDELSFQCVPIEVSFDTDAAVSDNTTQAGSISIEPYIMDATMSASNSKDINDVVSSHFESSAEDVSTLNNHDDVNAHENQVTLQGPSTLLGDMFSDTVKVAPYRFQSRDLLLFLKCAYEFKKNNFCTLIMSLCKGGLCLRNFHLKKLDMISIGFFLKNAIEPFKLMLTNCRIEANHLTVFRYQIMKSKRISVNLRKLFIQQNKLRAEGAHELSKLVLLLKNCELIELSSNNLCDEGLQHIIKMLPSLINLRAFSVASNNLTSVELLCSMISKHCHLTHLCLSYNPIGTTGAYHITEMLKICPTLIDLRVSNCQLCDDGVLVLAETLGQESKLEFLDLSDNDITEVGAAYLASSLSNSHLKKLLLGSNPIGSDGAGILFSALSLSKVFRYLDINNCNISMTDSLLEPIYELLTNSPIQKLNISYNNMTDDGLAAIIQILGNESCSIQHFSVAGSDMQVESSLALANILLQSSKLTHLTLSGTEVLNLCTDSESSIFQHLLDSFVETSSLSLIKFNIPEDDDKMKIELKQYLGSVNKMRKMKGTLKLKLCFNDIEDCTSFCYSSNEEEITEYLSSEDENM